ncbi:MAG: hypothetical protein LR005_00145 [Candidatus Pacebacteria bacterium]|nr:hypothetical protein [Candidatus Paceibacterota bacterium]
MEYNENQNFENNNILTQEPVILQEKKSHNKGLWYWIIAILLLGLLGWYGYAAGWFAKNTANMIPVESNNGIGDGAPDLGDLLKEGQAPIDNIIIKTEESFPVGKVLTIKGTFEDDCTYLNEEQMIVKGNIFYVNLTTHREGDCTPESSKSYESNIGLPVNGLPAGTYTVVINGKQTTFELEQDNMLDFGTELEK